jgi:hypothetical protein
MGGTYVCHDGLGNTLMAGQAPTCPAKPPATPACPASLQAANFAACTAPGQICAYPSACATTTYDQCTCFPGETATGGFGTIFTCKQAVCVTDGAAPDAAADATTMPEAAAEAASNSDASPDGAGGD